MQKNKNRIAEPKGFIKQIEFTAILIGVVLLLGSYLVLLYTFMSAWFSPIKTVVVHINQLGEALPELIFLTLTFPCVCYLLARLKWSNKTKRIWIDVKPSE